MKSDDELFPLCYYKHFVVRWNKDADNDNGVAIIIKWNGEMGYAEDYPSSCVYHSICVPDSGSTELPESMFDGVPDAAICKLYVFRVDVENIELNDTNLKLMAETHDVLSYILVRNIVN